MKDLEQIIENCKQGHDVSWAKLYKYIYPKVVGRLRILTNLNTELSKDLGSEVMEKIFHKLPSFQIGTNFIYWVYAITKNHYIDFYRKEGKFYLTSLDFKNNDDDDDDGSPIQIADTQLNPEQILEKKEKYKKLHQTLALALMDKSDYLEIIQLFYFQEMKLEEIANIKNISVESVKLKLFRAREIVKKFIKE